MNKVTKEELTQETIERLRVSQELAEALNKKRHEKVGRPKTGTAKTEYLMKGDTRFTIVVKKTTQQKLKHIALMDTRTLKDIFAEVLGGYIAQWESKNGTINLNTK